MFYPSRFSCFSIKLEITYHLCVCVIHPSRWCVGLIILCALVKTTRCMPAAGQQTDKLVHCHAVSIPSLMHPPIPALKCTPVHTPHAGVGHYESVSQLTQVSLNDEDVSSIHTYADTSFALTGQTYPHLTFFRGSSFA